MLRFLAILSMVVAFSAPPALSEGPRPAGYIMAYELKGIDAKEGKVVVRDGETLPPSLLMPLYHDDSVFILDQASKVTLSLAQEGNVVVSGKLMRKEIVEMPSSDYGFDIIGQIFDILLGDHSDDSISVLVAKGGEEIRAPMAVRGRNYVLRHGEPLQIAWTGGEGPFAVLIDEGQGGKPVSQAAREIEVPVAKIAGNRFSLVVTDVHKRKLRIAFELRKALPKVPAKVEARDNRGEVSAVWLAAQQNGAWRFEAARRLRALPQDKMTTGLIAALEKGWLPK